MRSRNQHRNDQRDTQCGTGANPSEGPLFFLQFPHHRPPILATCVPSADPLHFTTPPRALLGTLAITTQNTPGWVASFLPACRKSSRIRQKSLPTNRLEDQFPHFFSLTS